MINGSRGLRDRVGRLLAAAGRLVAARCMPRVAEPLAPAPTCRVVVTVGDTTVAAPTTWIVARANADRARSRRFGSDHNAQFV